MQFKMLIDGEWTDAQDGGAWEVINPATERAVADVPFGGAAETTRAIAAADAALPRWQGMTAYDRGQILRDIADAIRAKVDALAPIMTAECGKPLGEATGEWGACADLFDWFAEEGKRAYGRTIPARKPGKRLLSLPQPLGVVATITAWNFPAYLLARKWAGALAAGCTVVGRPSELTPMSAMALVNVMVEAGLPKGVVNLINGDPQIMGETILADRARAQAQLHRFTAGGADLDAGGGRWHQEAGHGIGRQRAGAGLRRLRYGLGGAARGDGEVPQ